MSDNPDYFNLLRKISKKPKASQRELAKDLGFSLGKLNYCLNSCHIMNIYFDLIDVFLILTIYYLLT